MKAQQIIRNPMIMTLGTLLLVVIILFAIQSFADSKFNLQGTLILSDSRANFETGKPCAGSGGYDDMQAGTSVKVKDGADNIIAVSELDEGKALDSSKCEFKYTVSDVPRTSIYQVEVSNRGGLTYNYDKLKENNFSIDSTLGE